LSAHQSTRGGLSMAKKKSKKKDKKRGKKK
jgi:hypothetical protein